MRATRQARRQAKGLFRLCIVDGLLDEQRVRFVVQRIGATRKRNRLALLAHLLRLARLYVARHTAAVQSAIPLPADLQFRFQADLAQAYGPGLATTFAQHPELIAGVRVQVGSDVYDGTIRAGLDALAGRV